MKGKLRQVQPKKISDFVARKPVLQEMLKELLQGETYDSRQKFKSAGKKKEDHRKCKIQVKTGDLFITFNTCMFVCTDTYLCLCNTYNIYRFKLQLFKQKWQQHVVGFIEYRGIKEHKEQEGDKWNYTCNHGVPTFCKEFDIIGN